MFFALLRQIQGTSTNPDRALTAEISDELMLPDALISNLKLVPSVVWPERAFTPLMSLELTERELFTSPTRNPIDAIVVLDPLSPVSVRVRRLLSATLVSVTTTSPLTTVALAVPAVFIRLSLMRFDNKIAIVTGGAKGIGLGVVELLTERGAIVAILDWDDKEGNEAVAKITKNGGNATFVSVNVANFGEVENAVNQTAKTFGQIDILAVSAGIQRYGTALNTSREGWDEVIEVNLVGAWNAAKASLPYLLKTKGAIVNVSSVQGLASQQSVLAYTVSKHGLIGLTRSIAMDFAKDGVRANVVCPGTVDTPMLHWAASLDANPQSVFDACDAMHPLGRIGKPREIAEVVAFLAHESSAFVTGAVWTVDGGLLTLIGGAPKSE